ncbi:hypothetical protein AVEN_122167-1, partial [Araneus ventricosus]
MIGSRTLRQTIQKAVRKSKVKKMCFTNPMSLISPQAAPFTAEAGLGGFQERL